MSYREHQRLADIQAAIDAIRSHLQRGDLTDGLIFDAVRIRLLEIGEAVKALPDDLLATQPSIPWRQASAGQADEKPRAPILAQPSQPAKPQVTVPAASSEAVQGTLARQSASRHPRRNGRCRAAIPGGGGEHSAQAETIVSVCPSPRVLRRRASVSRSSLCAASCAPVACMLTARLLAAKSVRGWFSPRTRRRRAKVSSFRLLAMSGSPVAHKHAARLPAHIRVSG